MAKDWRPGPVLVKEARLLQRRVADSIRSSRPPERGGAPGGTLGRRVRARGLVREKRWGAVIAWSSLGDTLTFFRRGTRRGQPARPLQLVPDRKRIRSAVLRSARAHFKRRERST